MKRIMAFLLIAIMLVSAVACAPAETTVTTEKPTTTTAEAEETKAPETKAPETEAPEADPTTDKLVIYTTVSEATVEAVVKEFEAQHNIKVEFVTAGVGELLKRIESEKDNPLGDVIWGAALSSIQAYDQDLFVNYVSENDEFTFDEYKNTTGYYTVYALAVRCFLVNENLIGDIEVKGYQDLLQDELKGQIAMVDPSASSSGYGHLSNMLFDMGKDGDPESDEAWAYVEAFANALDGKLLNSSSGVWKGVADGEYTVGLTYEEVALQAVKDGYPTRIVFAEEGAFNEPTSLAIINGAKNLTNAKLFVDFVTSYEIQSMMSNELNLRGARTDLDFDDAFVNTADIIMADADSAVASAKKSEWLDAFQDIWTRVSE